MKDSINTKAGLFPALLKYWRNARGLSQLDLSLAADVSARHVSFLETGRAKPSKEMVLSLANALQIPLREQNVMLDAAGFEAVFDEPGIEAVLQGPMGKVVQFMLDNHDPYPMMVMDWCYNIININKSAMFLFVSFLPDLYSRGGKLNIFEALFDPELARPFVVDWDSTARKFLSALHRASLLNSHDDRLNALINKIFTYPDIPENWRQPDFSKQSDPTLTVRLKKGDLELAFLTSMIQFNAPQNVTIEELRFESYIPLDDVTDQYFKDYFGITATGTTSLPTTP